MLFFGLKMHLEFSFPTYFVGTPNRIRRGERESARGAIFTSQTSTVTEAASDEIDDLDGELPRVTQ